jgi:hypothetical protein
MKNIAIVKPGTTEVTKRLRGVAEKVDGSLWIGRQPLLTKSGPLKMGVCGNVEVLDDEALYQREQDLIPAEEKAARKAKVAADKERHEKAQEYANLMHEGNLAGGYNPHLTPEEQAAIANSERVRKHDELHECKG